MSSEEEKNTNYSYILNEISRIKNLFLILYNDTIVKYLEKIITTDERKLMWIYLDGKKTQEEIAKLVGTKQATVSYFITYGKENNIIDDFDGQSKRSFNVIPKKWLDLIKTKKKNEKV